MKKMVLNCTTGIETEEDVPEPLKSPEEIAQEQKVAQVRARQLEAVNEAALAGVLKTVTPAEAVAYIDANVTDLASAKTALKLMARMVIALRDQVMPELPDQ